jgi:hypothetical protein
MRPVPRSARRSTHRCAGARAAAARPARAATVALALALAAGAAPRPVAAAAPAAPAAAGMHAEERFQLDLGVSRRFDRFQSREADSLGLSVSSSNVYTLAFDFRVLDIPAGTARPALLLSGRALTSERVFVPQYASAHHPVEESPMLETYGGARVRVPLGLVDGTTGVAFSLGWEGGVVIARSTGENFIQSSMAALGFERTEGLLEGSRVEMVYGHDDLYGAAWAAKRWGARVRLQTALAEMRPMPGPDGQTIPPGRPLRAFLEMSVNTDGRPGPDALGLDLGATLDLATLAGRLRGAIGL